MIRVSKVVSIAYTRATILIIAVTALIIILKRLLIVANIANFTYLTILNLLLT